MKPVYVVEQGFVPVYYNKDGNVIETGIGYDTIEEARWAIEYNLEWGVCFHGEPQFYSAKIEERFIVKEVYPECG